MVRTASSPIPTRPSEIAVVSTIATVIVTLRRRPVRTSLRTKSVRTATPHPVHPPHFVAHDLPEVELDDPAPHRVHDGRVVRGHQHRRPSPVDPLQQQHDVL